MNIFLDCVIDIIMVLLFHIRGRTRIRTSGVGVGDFRTKRVPPWGWFSIFSTTSSYSSWKGKTARFSSSITIYSNIEFSSTCCSFQLECESTQKYKNLKMIDTRLCPIPSFIWCAFLFDLCWWPVNKINYTWNNFNPKLLSTTFSYI